MSAIPIYRQIRRRAGQILTKHFAGSITPETLMDLTRDQGAICRSADPVYDVETCGATIMRPYSGDFWAIWGLPHENEYEHFSI